MPSNKPTSSPTTGSPTLGPTSRPTPAAPRECADVWETFAGDYTCGARIDWLRSQGETENQARYQVAVVEFPEICGPCAPSTPPPTPSSGLEVNKVGINLSTQLQANPLAANIAIAKLQDIAQAINLPQGMAIQKVKFFDYDTPNVLALIQQLDQNAPKVTDIMVSMPQWQVQQKRALNLQNLLDTYGKRFRFQIAIGNEPNHPGSYYNGVANDIEYAIDQAKAFPGVPVTVAFSFDCMQVSYPPENGVFKQDFLNEFRQVLEKSDFITINTYSFFAASDPNIPRQALYGPGVSVMENSIRAFQAALSKAGLGSKPVLLGETGWPSAPAGDDRSTTNAKAFYQNAAAWIQQNSQITAGYLFEAFDEEMKTGPAQEQHFGILYSDGRRKW